MNIQMRIFVDLNHREKDQQRNQSKNKRNSVRPYDVELLTSIYFRLIRDGLFSFYSLHNVFWAEFYVYCVLSSHMKQMKTHCYCYVECKRESCFISASVNGLFIW